MADLAKARDKQNQAVNFWPKYVLTTSQELFEKKATSQKLSTCEMNSKSSYWVITLHGRPSKGKKWEKLRSQFLPKICANG